jgi:hypothetical protein
MMTWFMRVSHIIGRMPIRALFCLPLMGSSAEAADLWVRNEIFPQNQLLAARGRALPACTETRPNHLISCVPRNIVLIDSDELIANKVYALTPSRQMRPYSQVFTWGP